MFGATARGRTAIIVTGGAPVMPAAVAMMPADVIVIAADSGLDHALQAGLRPDLVVGDLDSVSPSGLLWAREHGIPIEVHPSDKDMTDTQIALSAAQRLGVDAILLLAGNGDRLDHSMSAITALGHASLAWCEHVSAHWGRALVTVIRGPSTARHQCEPGATFSLLALHGECAGIELHGARWPLADATIEPGSSLGVSNVALGPSIDLSIRSGVVTLIFPTAFGGSL